MNDAATSLDNLRDIVELTQVSWWPPAAGWWVLMSVFAMIAIAQFVKAVLRWKADAYRRHALRALQTADSNVEIAQILKRTALSVFPRDAVARLSGTAWQEWLEQTGGVPMSDTVARLISEGVFGSREQEISPAMQDFVATWIRKHRRPEAC